MENGLFQRVKKLLRFGSKKNSDKHLAKMSKNKKSRSTEPISNDTVTEKALKSHSASKSQPPPKIGKNKCKDNASNPKSQTAKQTSKKSEAPVTSAACETTALHDAHKHAAIERATLEGKTSAKLEPSGTSPKCEPLSGSPTDDVVKHAATERATLEGHERIKLIMEAKKYIYREPECFLFMRSSSPLSRADDVTVDKYVDERSVGERGHDRLCHIMRSSKYTSRRGGYPAPVEIPKFPEAKKLFAKDQTKTSGDDDRSSCAPPDLASVKQILLTAARNHLGPHKSLGNINQTPKPQVHSATVLGCQLRNDLLSIFNAPTKLQERHLNRRRCVPKRFLSTTCVASSDSSDSNLPLHLQTNDVTACKSVSHTAVNGDYDDKPAEITGQTNHVTKCQEVAPCSIDLITDVDSGLSDRKRRRNCNDYISANEPPVKKARTDDDLPRVNTNDRN